MVLQGAAAAALLALAPPEPAQADALKEVVVDGVANERWVELAPTLKVPEEWRTRPGQRPKQSKFMLYTDTCAPNPSTALKPSALPSTPQSENCFSRNKSNNASNNLVCTGTDQTTGTPLRCQSS